MSEDLTLRECLMRDINDLKRERDEAREDVKRATYDAAQETIKVGTVKSHWIEACRERDHWKSESLEQAKLLAMGADREERLRVALQRLADCDWVISLPDRMDAVRKIAREALQ